LSSRGGGGSGRSNRSNFVFLGFIFFEVLLFVLHIRNSVLSDVVAKGFVPSLLFLFTMIKRAKLRKITVFPLAFEHLKVAVEIAETKFVHQPRAKSGLPVLQNMVIAAHQAIAAIGPGPTSSIPSSNRQPSRGRSQLPSKTRKRLSPDEDMPKYSHDSQFSPTNGISSSWSFSAAPSTEAFYPDLASMNFAQPSSNGVLTVPTAGSMNGMAGSSNSIPSSYPIASGRSLEFDQSVQIHTTYGADSDINMFTELLPQERSDWDFTSIFASEGRPDLAPQSNGAYAAFTWNFPNGQNVRSN